MLPLALMPQVLRDADAVLVGVTAECAKCGDVTPHVYAEMISGGESRRVLLCDRCGTIRDGR